MSFNVPLYFTIPFPFVSFVSSRHLTSPSFFSFTFHRVPKSFPFVSLGVILYHPADCYSFHWFFLPILACVASVPVRSERNSGSAYSFFAFRTREKWGESKKVEGRGWGRGKKGKRSLLSSPPPPSLHLFAPAPFFARPEFRSLRTGTLATQAMPILVHRLVWCWPFFF